MVMRLERCSAVCLGLSRRRRSLMRGQLGGQGGDWRSWGDDVQRRVKWVDRHDGGGVRGCRGCRAEGIQSSGLAGKSPRALGVCDSCLVLQESPRSPRALARWRGWPLSHQGLVHLCTLVGRLGIGRLLEMGSRGPSHLDPHRTWNVPFPCVHFVATMHAIPHFERTFKLINSFPLKAAVN